MVEGPVDALQPARALVLGGGAIVEADEHRPGPGRVVAAQEFADDEGGERLAEVALVPGALAEEVGEVAGVGRVQGQPLQAGKGLTVGGDAEGVGEDLEVAQLGLGEGQRQQGGEVDEGRQRVYDALHGPSPATAVRIQLL